MFWAHLPQALEATRLRASEQVDSWEISSPLLSFSSPCLSAASLQTHTGETVAGVRDIQDPNNPGSDPSMVAKLLQVLKGGTSLTEPQFPNLIIGVAVLASQGILRIQ